MSNNRKEYVEPCISGHMLVDQMFRSEKISQEYHGKGQKRKCMPSKKRKAFS